LGGAHPDCRYLCLHYLPLLHKNPEDRRRKPSLNAAQPYAKAEGRQCFFWYRPTWVVPEERPLNGVVVIHFTMSDELRAKLEDATKTE